MSQNVSRAQRERLDQDRQHKLDQLHRRLSDQVKHLHHGQGWRDWLTVASKLHRYSWRNSLLIQLQNPDATLVAGYNTWKSLGRQVDKGQKGLQILAPIKRRIATDDPDEEQRHENAEAHSQQGTPHARQVVGYRVAHCWDVSQTSGRPLPVPPQPQLLSGQAPVGLWDALAEQVGGAGFDLERGDCGAANGWTDFASRTVRIRDDVDAAQAVKTLAHELAHVRLHDPRNFSASTARCRGTAEVEAESIAFLVAGAHGMNTDDYTFPYVATWASSAANPDEVIARTAERVVGTARQVIDDTGLVRAAFDDARAALTHDRNVAELGQHSHGPHRAVPRTPPALTRPQPLGPRPRTAAPHLEHDR